MLCELAGTKGKVVAELTVPENGVGRVVAGQEVKLLYDAFPYERYGARHGRVRWVSPASVTKDDAPAAATKSGGPAFRALVDLDETTVLVKGGPRPLLRGMGGRGRVVVGRRSLLSDAFEPLHSFVRTWRPQPAEASRDKVMSQERGSDLVTRTARPHRVLRQRSYRPRGGVPIEPPLLVANVSAPRISADHADHAILHYSSPIRVGDGAPKRLRSV